MIKPKWKTKPNADIADQLQKQIDEVGATAMDNILLSYIKYKKFYDRKASAAPLKRLLLQTQSESRQPVDKVRVPGLHVDRTVNGNQSFDKQ